MVCCATGGDVVAGGDSSELSETTAKAVPPARTTTPSAAATHCSGRNTRGRRTSPLLRRWAGLRTVSSPAKPALRRASSRAAVAATVSASSAGGGASRPSRTQSSSRHSISQSGGMSDSIDRTALMTGPAAASSQSDPMEAALAAVIGLPVLTAIAIASDAALFRLPCVPMAQRRSAAQW